MDESPMTFREFKSWLDGFKEGVDDAPTPEQWAKILETVERVTVPAGYQAQ